MGRPVWTLHQIRRIARRVFLYARCSLICVVPLLSACGSQVEGELTALEVFRDPAVAQLAEAAAKGDEDAVVRLVRQGVNVDAQNEDGISILVWAFAQDSIDGMLALLQAGADPALADKRGLTVMHYAAEVDDPARLQALLDAGVSPDLRNPLNGQTPIFNAIAQDREPQFHALIAAGADVNVRELNNPDGHRWLSGRGYAPLHHAASCDGGDFHNCYDGKYVLPLLQAGADPQLEADNEHQITFREFYSWHAAGARYATDALLENWRKVEAWLVEQGIDPRA